MRRKVLDPGHNEIAATLNNLAIVHKRKTNYAKSLELYEEAQQVLMVSPETEKRHIDIANQSPPLFSLQLRDVESRQLKLSENWNNKAAVHSQLGDMDTARKLHEQVLAVRTRLLGDALPTATSKYNLAVVAFYQDRLDECETLVSGALRTRQQLLGPTNPSTMNARGLLGEVYLKTSRVSAALEAFQVG